MPNATPRPNRPNRTATTLIEVIGTMSVLLVLAVSAASILGLITEIGARNTRARQARLSIERLAGTFRNDVHRAGNIDVAAEDLLVEMTVGKETIRYRWDAQQQAIMRSASEGEKRLESDRFAVCEDCRPEVSSSDGIVALALNQDTQTKLPKSWVIEARQ